MSQARDRGLAPALLAELQRAKSEIEAALSIAANMPRDEKCAVDAILVSCQRPGLAEKAQFQYARGGTDISGPTIVLMEAIVQRWGNVDFGFRELARYPGRGGHPGESVVEAYAWDLQTNTRRKVQFSVEHAMKAHGKTKVLTDPRDIYEYIANQAQRRVRTCLENIIPRDIVDMAREECDRTLKAELKDVAEAAKKMVAAFSQFGVSQRMIEGRIQRRLDAITPAQILGMKKIYASLRDGMSDPADWFEMEGEEEPEKESAIEQAKAAMRKAAATEQPAGTGPGVPSGAGKGEKPKAAPPPEEKRAQKAGAAPPAAPAVKPSPKPEEAPHANGSQKESSPQPAAAPTESPTPPPQGMASEPVQESQNEQPAESGPEGPEGSAEESTQALQAQQWLDDLKQVNTVRGLKDALAAIPPTWPSLYKEVVANAIREKIDSIHGGRGQGSKKPGQKEMFEPQAAATEAGM